MSRPQPYVDEALKAGFELRTGWQLKDPRIRADAMAFWARHKFLPPKANPNVRADEIVVSAYMNGDLAAVGTLYMSEITLLARRFAVWRVAVSPDYRRHHLMFAMGGRARDIVEAWSLEHPEANIAGMASITTDPKLMEAKLPGVLPGSGLMMIGYTPEGNRIRVAWFDHARV
jgi:hypothetical protein